MTCYVKARKPRVLWRKSPVRAAAAAAGKEDKNNLLVPDIKHNEVSELPLKYLETDIYRVSREVKKMQRINDNILTAWYEVDSGRYIDTKHNI